MLPGVTAFEASEATLLPALLTACTVNVYVTPLDSPVTVIGLPAPVTVIFPGIAVTS
ncbi:hypothetical protein D3C80_1835730 [compost metagenome]